jgi:hypothetical protein
MIINNVVLIQLYQAFLDNIELADPYYFFSDIEILNCILLFVFFVFIGYEFMRKAKEANIEETLVTAGNRGRLIYLEQLFVLWSTVMVVTINIALYILAGYIKLGMSSVFMNDMIKMIFVEIFLLSLASVSMGYIISKLKHRFAGYAVIIGILFFILPPTNSLLLEWNFVYHIPIFVIRDFIFLLPPDLTAAKDPLYGLSLEWYRSASMLFWIFASFLLCGWEICRLRKRIRLVFGIGILGIMFYMGYGVINKGSVLLQYMHPESSMEESINYYLQNPKQEIEANFSVTDYDMELSFGKQLSAKVTLSISADQIHPEYFFTLHHGYKIREIVTDTGSSIPYSQEGDYIEINNESLTPIKTLCFLYEGYSSTFYSNSKSCFLPGFFPYYPKAGYRMIFDEDYHTYVQKKEEEANYRVKVIGQSVASNLKGSHNVFEGRTDNVTLIAGYYDLITANGNTGIYYPLQSGSYEDIANFYSGETNREFNDLCAFLGLDLRHTKQDKLLIKMPGSMVFNSMLNSYYESKDTIIFDFLDPYVILENKTNAPEKETLKEVFFFIRPDSYTNLSEITLFEDLEEFEGEDKFTEIHDAFVLKMRELGVQEAAGKVIEFLHDEKNTTDELTFLKELK